MKTKRLFYCFLVITLAVNIFPGCSDDSAGPEKEHPPGSPHSPVPADGAAARDTFITLSWQCSDPDGDDLEFEVYIRPEGGAEESFPVDEMTLEMQDPLEPYTDYTWKVTASDGGRSTTGSDWTFTTCASMEMPPQVPENPSPPDLSSGQPVNISLSWDCIDPNLNDTITYDIYFGQNNPPPLLYSDLQNSACNPGQLEYATTYYWYVSAEDEAQNRTDSPVWSFSTGSESQGEGIFALLVAGRNISFFDPTVFRMDGLYARFDSSYAPCSPADPLHPGAVTCNEYTLEWDDITGMYKYEQLTYPTEFLTPGETCAFDITGSSTVPPLSKSVVFPLCEPYVTSPAYDSGVSRSGFTATWEGYSCGGEVRLVIVAASGDTTGVDVMTENDGSYTFTSQQLSSISGPQSNCALIMILQNSDMITAPGYDPRSYIWGRVINTTVINFID
ncbi:MAG: hypothetical protein R6U43_10140 [Candidatus Krumholzibacteriales bacterium]